MPCFDCNFTTQNLTSCICGKLRCISCLLACCHVFEQSKTELIYCCNKCCTHPKTNTIKSKGNGYRKMCISIETQCLYQIHTWEARRCSTPHGKPRLCLDFHARRWRIVPLCDFHTSNFNCYQESISKTNGYNPSCNRVWKCCQETCIRKAIYYGTSYSNNIVLYCLEHAVQFDDCCEHAHPIDQKHIEAIEAIEKIGYDQEWIPIVCGNALHFYEPILPALDEDKSTDSSEGEGEGDMSSDSDLHSRANSEDFESEFGNNRFSIADDSTSAQERIKATEVTDWNRGYVPVLNYRRRRCFRSVIYDETEQKGETVWKLEWGQPPPHRNPHNAQVGALVFPSWCRRRFKKFTTLLEQWLIRGTWNFILPPFPSCIICRQTGVVCQHKANWTSRFSTASKFQTPLKKTLAIITKCFQNEWIPNLPSFLFELVYSYVPDIPYLFSCSLYPLFGKSTPENEYITLALHYEKEDLRQVWDHDMFSDSVWTCMECIQKHAQKDSIVRCVEGLVISAVERM